MKLPPPVLPNWHPRSELSRPTAQALRRVENRKSTLTYAGPNAVIPVVYGEQLVGGPIIAGPVVWSASVYYAVALCWAGSEGVHRIEDARLGDTISPLAPITDPDAGVSVSVGGVIAQVYDGRQTSVDSQLINAIPGFDDNFHGIAYARLRFPVSSNFTSLPQITFRVKGRRCFDPRVESGHVTFWSTIDPGLGENVSVVTCGVYQNNLYAIAGGVSGAVSRAIDFGIWEDAESPFPPSGIRAGGGVRLFGEDGKAYSLALNSGAWPQELVEFGSFDINSYSDNGASRWLVAGDGGKVSVSSGGNWWRSTLPGSPSLYACLAIGTTLLVVAGPGGFLATASFQGAWEERDAQFGSSAIRSLVSAQFDGGAAMRVMAFGDDGKASISPDGINWQAVDAGFGADDIVSAVFCFNAVIAVSSTGAIRFSTDGEQWQPLPDHPAGKTQKLMTYEGYLFAISDSSSFQMTSYEAIFGTYWTENPALHMHDFVTNTEIGMGVGMIGTAQAADICDSLYSGIPRSRTGLCIQDPMTEEDALSLFAQYAEVLWSYDGRDVTVIPDAPVQTIHSIDAGDMREGSLQLSTVGLEQIPTQVRIQFSDRDNPEWPSRPAVAEVPEHTMHGLPTSPSSVPLPGVFNRLEAERRAYQRLWRLQAPGRLQWQMFAPGMPYQAGDVLRLPDRRGLHSVDVRLTAQPEMVGPMQYQMGGEIYRASSYPTGAAGIAVPTGAILILRGSAAVPAGWDLVNTSNRFIREGAPGNAGTVSSVSFSFPTGVAGEHLGTRSTQNLSLLNSPPPGTDPSQNGMPIVYLNANGSTPQPSDAHAHSFSGSISTLDAVDRSAVRFVKRTGAPSLLAPGLAFLGYTNLTSVYAIEAAGLSGRYLAGGTSESTHNRTSSRSFRTSGRASHVHNAYMCQPRYNPGSGIVTSTMGQEAGEHDHSASVSFNATLRSIALAVFESVGDAALPEGAIVGWDGGAAPAGWALCDGSNGTIDLTERFIYITALAQAGGEHEDMSEITITASGSTSSGGAHNHSRVFTVRTPDGSITGANYNPFHTDSAGGHSHSVSGNKTDSLDNVQRYQLRFIQYIG